MEAVEGEGPHRGQQGAVRRLAAEDDEERLDAREVRDEEVPAPDDGGVEGAGLGHLVAGGADPGPGPGGGVEEVGVVEGARLAAAAEEQQVRGVDGGGAVAVARRGRGAEGAQRLPGEGGQVEGVQRGAHGAAVGAAEDVQRVAQQRGGVVEAGGGGGALDAQRLAQEVVIGEAQGGGGTRLGVVRGEVEAGGRGRRGGGRRRRRRRRGGGGGGGGGGRARIGGAQ